MLEQLDVAEAARPSLAPEAGADAAIWASLAETQDLAGFGRAWLTLASRSFEAIRRSALLAGPADTGPFRPVARWSRRPDGTDVETFVDQLGGVLAVALERRRPALEELGPDPSGRSGGLAVGYPLLVLGQLQGIVLAEVQALDGRDARRLVRHLQWSSGWYEAFLRRAHHHDSTSLGEKAETLVHAVEAVVSETRLAGAGRVFVGFLERRFACHQVVVTRTVRRHSRLLAVSQTAAFEGRSRSAKLFAAASDEAIDQNTALTAPAADDLPYVTLAQEALRRETAGAHILTVPLVAAGDPFGAVILARADRAFTQEEVDLADALATAVAPILFDKARTDRSLPVLVLSKLGDFAGKLFGRRHLGLKLGTIAAIAVAAFFAVATDDYRIRAKAEVQGEVRRSMSAPFDGFIRAARARAGDVVEDGAVLAELQDNDLVLDRLRQLARKRQYQSELDKALAKRDLAGTNIAQAQVAQTDAEIELSDQMLARARITAPFKAVIVSGDLSQSIGRPVTRGDALFELAPLDQYRVTLVVPEGDIRLVTPGMKGEILLSALPEHPFPFEIRSVTPVARANEGVNGFEAIGALSDSDPRIRPGMEGVAKVEAGERSLFWIWTHPFVHWVRIKVWELIP